MEELVVFARLGRESSLVRIQVTLQYYYRRVVRKWKRATL